MELASPLPEIGSLELLPIKGHKTVTIITIKPSLWRALGTDTLQTNTNTAPRCEAAFDKLQ